MEEQLLPLASLRPAYPKAVWMYVYRDFSGSEADVAAENVALRLGMTSYPQHFLVRPDTLEDLGDTGRAAPGFLAAFDRARVNGRVDRAAGEALRKADALAEGLRTGKDPAAARKALANPDVLVRIRAAEVLLEKDPKGLVASAAQLLEEPNDPLRYAVCRGLAKAADPKVAPALEALARDAKSSRNPNVLRMHAVEALGACGNAASVAAVAPHAAAGWRNGLTRKAVDALVAIAERDKAARPAVRAALLEALPAPEAEASAARAVLALAKAVHAALEKATGKKAPFPDAWDAAAREKLRKAFGP
jgi:hypothetical protein